VAEQTVIIVVPCYNETQRFKAEAFVAFADANPDVRFLFSNDGSTDGTKELLDRTAGSRPDRLVALHLPKNGGKGEAVRAGMLAAMERYPESLAVGFFDADLATPLDEIAGFVAIVRERPGIEMVFGSRVNLLGRKVRRNLKRHYIGRVFATLASWMLGLGIYDTQCGAKLFRTGESLKRLLAEPFLSRWIFDVEILARLVKERRGTTMPQPEDVIVEQPLKRWEDVFGSKLKTKDFWTVAGDLWRIQRRYLRGVPRPRLSP
jgi:dolichyl-phosphate beta-glucosyltransferase